MANTSINLTALDFDEIKSNLKTFLQTKPQFNYVDFEGANINVLLDVLAYNTYLNAFYLNMVASEMFIDSAQLRESIVSHAKALNYVPRSFRSAEAVINLRVTPSSNAVTTVTVPARTEFLSRVGSNTYVFSTVEDIVLTSSNGTFIANNVSIYEGPLVEDTYVVDTSNTSQRFVLSNPNIDTRSLQVYVSENSGQNV